ncbi:lupeol synthase-like isoform X2 [Coffea eugenioides]|uniref:lupeol synthase-like isoform X2 n=1 Tax=Coffea eugenioides TaxID=49369 RepID=UPI000F605F10|nr:lupeol synthase-like isoform X2 [Coffea eugenioides]
MSIFRGIVIDAPDNLHNSIYCPSIKDQKYSVARKPQNPFFASTMWKLRIAEGSGPWLTTTNGHVGRQHWEFDPDAGTPEERAQVDKVREEFRKNGFRRQQSADLLMRMQLRKENSPCPPMPPPVNVKETDDVTEEAVTTTLRRGISFFSTLQANDGHWPAESAGPLFFLPPLVMALYITGTLNMILSYEHQKEIIRYIYNHQNEDGGWGLHIEGHSIMFGSVFNYITLRLLGEGPEDGEHMAMARGRKWILDHGGAVAIPSWGKFWLSVLGLYDWAGCNPVPPEFWLIPKFFPIHPAQMICYSRLVYMPMSYLYGKRFVGAITRLVHSLRDELYIQPYHQINWSRTRYTCAKDDLYYPHPLVQDMLWGFLYHFAEPILLRWPFTTLREKALEKAMEHIHYEDENSRYFCIGAVEKVLCLLACWVEDPDSEAFKRHIARLPDYFWVAEDGLKMQTFGSQAWEGALAIQAILRSNLVEEYVPMLKKAHDFIKASQVQNNPSGNFTKMHRHISKGCWTFSIQDHGWQAVDCTAEGLKVALLLGQMPPEHVGDKIEIGRLYDAVNIILSLQGKDGGFRAWEPQRAYRWMEMFNPTDLFGDVIIERGYVECTSSAIQTLLLFKKLHPGHRESEIERCISKALAYIEDEQEQDGSWYGRWAICYTYATWFAVEALVACGMTYNDSPAIRKACKFLLSKQLPDGGWGESYLSCSNEEYTNLEGDRSNLVQTSWALLTLIAAGQVEHNPAPIHRGLRLLINSQMEDGDFPQQEITGVFFKNCIMQYSAYRNVFPIWALGEFRRRVLHA